MLCDPDEKVCEKNFFFQYGFFLLGVHFLFSVIFIFGLKRRFESGAEGISMEASSAGMVPRIRSDVIPGADIKKSPLTNRHIRPHKENSILLNHSGITNLLLVRVSSPVG